MYLQGEIVSFKEEKRKQKLYISKNKKLILEINKLLDGILNEYSFGSINQTFVYEINGEIFYIRKINRYKKSYYSIQKMNKENIIDYKFEYFYGNAMVNTDKGIKIIKKFNITQDTLEILLFDLKDIFKNNNKIISLINKVSIK